MNKLMKRFANDESGATAIEYGLLAALIGVGIIAAASALGDQLSSLFNDVSTAISGARTHDSATSTRSN